MAYVKILAINCRNDYMQTAVEYAVNPDKTIEERLGIAGEYATDPGKTELDEVRYASCINIPGIDDATETMMATKRRFGKTDGRLGYHIIQSFSPDDNITPEQAHEIGRQYAQELFGDFEVVIGTHVDKGHIHNHIVMNSVSCVDGHKFHAKNGYLRHVMRETSDRYCKENGLSVIEWTSNREMTQKEWFDRHWREGTFRESINLDIRAAAGRARSVAELLVGMENMGYKVDASRKHITLLPPDGRKAWRLDKFYTDDELKLMTEGGGMARMAARRYTLHKTKYRVTRGRREPQKLTQFQYMYLRWLKLLGEQRRQPGRTYIPKAEYRKFDQYKKQIQFTGEHGLRKLSQVISFREGEQARLKALNIEKYRLLGRKNKYAKLFEAHKAVMRWTPIITKLDSETQEEYAAALAVLKKGGFENDAAGVERLRVELESEILRNKGGRMETQERIRMCGSIEKGMGLIVPAVKQAQRERETETGWEPERREKPRERDKDIGIER
ncbi:MAG TPA: hypothetical protein DEB31_11300 [Clostridiales bacterium]|nr:hypothetical protein [Clostridiales bacterium]